MSRIKRKLRGRKNKTASPAPRKRKKKISNQQGSGIRCPLCEGRTKVYHSVPHPEKNEQHRYRKCDVCYTKIYTVEYIDRTVGE